MKTKNVLPDAQGATAGGDDAAAHVQVLLDAERYRWWREHIDCIEEDGDGITGLAFCYQIPLHGLDPSVTEPQTSGQLMDAIADRALRRAGIDADAAAASQASGPNSQSVQVDKAHKGDGNG